MGRLKMILQALSYAGLNTFTKRFKSFKGLAYALGR